MSENWFRFRSDAIKAEERNTSADSDIGHVLPSELILKRANCAGFLLVNHLSYLVLDSNLKENLGIGFLSASRATFREVVPLRA